MSQIKDNRIMRRHHRLMVQVIDLLIEDRYINLTNEHRINNEYIFVEPTMYLMMGGMINLSKCRTSFEYKHQAIRNKYIPRSIETLHGYLDNTIPTDMFINILSSAAIGGLTYGMLLRPVKWDKLRLRVIKSNIVSVL